MKICGGETEHRLHVIFLWCLVEDVWGERVCAVCKFCRIKHLCRCFRVVNSQNEGHHKKLSILFLSLGFVWDYSERRVWVIHFF